LNGVVFKVHGSARELAVQNAVAQVVQALRVRVNRSIVQAIASARNQIGTVQAA
jgi:fatty acid/phospholipid biosynthesis enzyme